MLGKIEAWLDGKKSYIVAIGLIGAAVFQFLAHGDFSLPAIVTFFQSAGLAAAIAALRSAIGGGVVRP